MGQCVHLEPRSLAGFLWPQKTVHDNDVIEKNIYTYRPYLTRFIRTLPALTKLYVFLGWLCCTPWCANVLGDSPYGRQNTCRLLFLICLISLQRVKAPVSINQNEFDFRWRSRHRKRKANRSENCLVVLNFMWNARFNSFRVRFYLDVTAYFFTLFNLTIVPLLY